MLRRLSDRMYDETIAPGAAGAELAECYAMILRIYINLNRWASVDPPSRELIECTFADADVNQDGILERGEFRRLVKVVATRGVARVVAYYLVNAAVGPLLALLLAARLTKMRAWAKATSSIVQLLPAKLGSRAGSPALVQAFVTVVFAWTVGDVLLKLLYSQIDRIRIRPSIMQAGEGKAFKRMRRMQNRRNRRVLRALSEVSALQALSEYQLRSLVSVMRVRSLAQGEAVFHQGEEGDAFYVIASGTATVTRVGDDAAAAPRVIATLGEGSCFGERALLTKEERYGSVVATSERLTVMQMTRADFEQYNVGGLLAT